MKKISLIIFLSFIVLFLLVVSLQSICFSEPDSKVWESFSDNMYYNKTNVTKSSQYVAVWTYNTVTDDYKKQTVEVSKKHDPELSERYKNYDHFITLWGFDCEKKLFRIKERIDYDDRWKIINKYTYKNEERVNIAPGSPTEKLYNKVCVTPHTTSKQK
jgi:hypothetical protein